MSRIRLRPLSILLLLLGTLYFLISSTLGFARIFSQPHAGIPLSQGAIKRAYENRTEDGERRGDGRQAVIPRKLHQIYHDWNGNVPHKEQWMRLRDSCINRNPGWEYKLWSTAESREFLQREYAWFLPTYDSYKYPVQRVDAMKYFILRHYGGIYIDMDNGCLESLEPLRYYPVFVTDNVQGSLDNNIMGTVPHHPFFEYVTNHIWTYSLVYYPYPYLAVMYNSGQWFFTAMWERYHDEVTPMNWNIFSDDQQQQQQQQDLASGGNGKQLYRVIMDNRRGAEPWVFWNEGAGLTWQDWDYGLFMSIGEKIDRIIRVVVMVTSACSLVVGLVVWRCCCSSSRRRRARKAGVTHIHDGARKARAGLRTVADLLSPVLSPVKGKADSKTDHELV